MVETPTKYFGVLSRHTHAQLQSADGFHRDFLRRPLVPFPLEIDMPCGNKCTFESFAELPTADVPCPCGDPNHWIVKYDIKEEEEEQIP